MDSQGPIEVAISTDLRGKPHHFSLWDIYTGTQIVIFKGSTSNVIPKCLELIDNNYFITANDNILHIWSISSRKCLDQKLFLPGRASTICMSPCGNYISVGIAETIYVWQLRSGYLLATAQRHYQTVTVMRMNHEGNFLFSGGEDGVVLVWPFADLISKTHNTGSLKVDKNRKDIGINQPRFSWQHHNGQVTDIKITNGGLCITSSTDMSMNVYSYADGKRLYSVMLPSRLWSLAINKNETKIFLGGQDGNIYEVAISSLSISNIDSTIEDRAIKPIFKGHKDKVISLLVSADGSRIISASLDSTCKIWDTYQRKMLQDIKHQAPLANLTTLIIPNGLALTSMSQMNLKQSTSFKSLKRNLYKRPREIGLSVEDLFNEGYTTIINGRNKLDLWSVDKELEACNNVVSEVHQRDPKCLEDSTDQDQTILHLKKNIRKLYELSAAKIFKDAAGEGLKTFDSVINNMADAPKKLKSKKVVSTPRMPSPETPSTRRRSIRVRQPRTEPTEDSDIVYFEEDIIKTPLPPRTRRTLKRLRS